LLAMLWNERYLMRSQFIARVELRLRKTVSGETSSPRVDNEPKYSACEHIQQHILAGQ
jgi:hypothetical protein